MYVDLKTLSAIKVNTTEAAWDDADGVQAIIDALKDAGYTLPEAGQDGAPTVNADGDLVGNAIKNGVTYPYKWNVSASKNVSGKTYIKRKPPPTMVSLM